jgi:hypothetical protein
MIGQKFGKLTVLSEAGRRNRSRLWLCACDCGNAAHATTGHLNAGERVSCGCVVGGHKNLKHGMSHSQEYKAWDGARDRCRNPKNKKYPLYGGRGIKFCARWEGSFQNFLEDMGRKPSPDLSLDRIDSDGPYSPENCRWATIFVQNNNRTFGRLKKEAADV